MMPNQIHKADLRVNLLLMIVNAVAGIILVREIYFILLFAAACLWLCLRKKTVKALKFVFGYAALYGLASLTLGIKTLSTIWIFSNVLRHLLIPIAYADGLTDAPTGKLLAVFQKLHLPKSFGISTVVLLRFIPTISYELSAIRSSLKFRGVGLGFWSTLLHIPANFENTLVPLLIRTTRIAEELSAAAMVRGVRLNNKIISLDEVSFKGSDGAIAVLFCLAVIAVCIMEPLALLEVFI